MYDIVADCSDNVPTRYLVNDACVLSGKPLVSASALRMEGQVGCGDILVPPHYTQFNEIYCIIVCVSVCVCVSSWLCITTAEAPATDVYIHFPHLQRR